MTDHTKPIDTVRLPGGLKATTWENESEQGRRYTTTRITKTIRTDGGFKDVQSFTHDELLPLARIAGLAYDALAERRRAMNAETTAGASD